MRSLDSVLESVRERVTPTAAEHERLAAAVADLTDRAEAAIAERDVEADVVQVGSTARGTWLAGDRDIDLFVRFSPDLPRADLERYGLEIGHAVLPSGREEYAEHPYVKGTHEGFDVDLVPCYRVESAREIRSAVDRTPFHTAYLGARLDADLAEDVRICKRFGTAAGVYGSDLRTEGFSGYLTELLVLEYGGFAPLCRAAADWQPPVVLDPESHGERTFDAPLTVVDPTDPERNVAAVVAAENVARFQHVARDLLAEPREALFHPPERPSLEAAAVREHLRRRETTAVALVFETPDVVDDQLYPQLEKSRLGIAGGLDAHEFHVVRSTAFADDARSVLLFELSVATLPAVERHVGPPVAVREHAEGFFETYVDDDAVYGPFLDGDRYVVERPRDVTDAVDYLEGDRLFEVALGTRVEAALEADYAVLVDDAIADLAGRFGTDLGAYFEPTVRG
ncbi:MAG: CCA tRNA nucleotidyltransferase [Haloferacaceae archaeon]